MIEVEVKIKAAHSDLFDKLEKLGFARTTTEYEKDIYYNGIKTDLKSEDKALRIREYSCGDMTESKFILNFKGNRLDESTMTRPETEFEIPGFDEGDTLLRGIGFIPKGMVEKTRIIIIKDEVTVCLDEVTGLGEFVEIEIMESDEAGYNTAMEKIQELMKKLGLDMSESIRTSYLSMLESRND